MGGLGRLLGIAWLSAAFLPTLAHAEDNDLVLSRLGTQTPSSVIGSNIEFRALASQLGVVLAPRLSEPADTLGFGGFHFSADVAYTSINSDAAYWRVLESSPGASGTHGNGTMATTGLFVKKGIWLPLPSFEVGLGAVHLGQSHLWAGQAYVKFALHEGYHELPLPSIAVRGAASRMMGSEQIDLTVASLDISASKDFGIAGLFRVSPYGGWNWLFIIPRSEVIDKTPNVDLLEDPMDIQNNFVFKNQDNINRSRVFAGAKLKYYVFTLTMEAAYTFGGSSVDDTPGTDLDCRDIPSPTSQCDAVDSASGQSSFTTSLGLDF